MLSAVTLLLDTRLNPEQLDLTRVIQESGEVLLQVINDILDYSKLASGSFSISHDIINVVEIIQSVFRAHEKCVNPNVKLDHQLDSRLPKAAEGDSLRYRQIVQNLMSNATKFTEHGYVQIHATLQKEDEASYTILTEVLDTGIGVATEVSGALFTPFTQFDDSATKRYKGTGLGLSICKSLAELMNGNIGFHPNPEGRGSVFWFTCRLMKAKHLKNIEEDLNAVALKIPRVPFEELRLVAADKRLLLVEDNAINKKVMLKILKGLGFQHIDLASDGRQAVTMSTNHQPPYHLILMDINMPLLDGVGATKEIRHAGIRSPIVAMTANALKGQSELYIAKGMNAYVSKPVDRNVLVKVLLASLGPDTSD
jgi:osomolarity two-component system sensor histidine kinase TcsA